MSSEQHVGEAPADAAVVDEIRDEILGRQRFLLTSHARPDGDSIGSQLAMAFALDALGKQVRIVNSDAAPDHYQDFPGMERIEISRRATGTGDVDAVIVMECSDLGRSGVQGLEETLIIKIYKHAGNRL
jgi:phosphoesterase RecJ-like protein